MIGIIFGGRSTLWFGDRIPFCGVIFAPEKLLHPDIFCFEYLYFPSVYFRLLTLRGTAKLSQNPP